MNCTKCGAGTVELERIERSFSEHLPGIIIDGISEGRCPACGETVTSYPRWSELSSIVLENLLAKPSRLTAGEIRFLRLKAGLKGQVLAETLGVTPSQVSRWENGAVSISALADRLLRMVAAARANLSPPELKNIDASRSAPLAMKLVLGSRGWKVLRSDAQAA